MNVPDLDLCPARPPARRLADTYPNQMVEINVMFFLYRWHAPVPPEPGQPPKPVLSQFQLEVRENPRRRARLSAALDICSRPWISAQRGR